MFETPDLGLNHTVCFPTQYCDKKDIEIKGHFDKNIICLCQNTVVVFQNKYIPKTQKKYFQFKHKKYWRKNVCLSFYCNIILLQHCL